MSDSFPTHAPRPVDAPPGSKIVTTTETEPEKYLFGFVARSTINEFIKNASRNQMTLLLCAALLYLGYRFMWVPERDASNIGTIKAAEVITGAAKITENLATASFVQDTTATKLEAASENLKATGVIMAGAAKDLNEALRIQERLNREP